MTAPERPPEIRREARYVVCNEDALDVSIESEGDDGAPAGAGRVIDISASGAKLSLPVRLEKGQTAVVCLSAEDLKVKLRLQGKCCWVQPEGGQTWKAGFAFAKKVPQKTLDLLARNGVLERRSDPRRAIDLEADATWELGGNVACPVRLLELSAGGFRLSIREPQSSGSRVRLEMVDLEGKPLVVHGIALWQEAVDDGYEVGCRYLARDGYRQLRRAVAEEEAPEEEPRRPLNLRPWALVGLLVAVAWFGREALAPAQLKALFHSLYGLF